MAQLETEIATYDRVRSALERDHAGKFALVHENGVAGIFDSELDAYKSGLQRFGLLPFLIREIGEKPHQVPIAAYTIVEASAKART